MYMLLFAFHYLNKDLKEDKTMTDNKYLAWTALSFFILSVSMILLFVFAFTFISDTIENPILFMLTIGLFSLMAAILGLLSFKLPQAKVATIGGLAVLLLALFIIPVKGETTRTTTQPEINVQGQYFHTGVAEIDTVIDTVLAGNQNDVSQLLQFNSLACTHADGLGGPPKCTEGETEGALVDVFPVLGPEGHHMRYSDLDQWEGIPAKNVYAVYRVSANAYSDEVYPAGEYAIVFLTELDELLVTVQVTNGKIVRIDNNLGYPPEINLERDASEIILAPQK